jgi:hypothetical protein
MSLVNSWPALSVQVGEGTEQLPFGNPNRRRVWLLSKALECHALSEALELAKIAERFICGGRPQGTNRVTESTAAFPCVDELAVLASVEEIVRYLKQSDDAPFDEATPKDGDRPEQSYDDLLARANERRRCHHLPPFQLRPTVISERTMPSSMESAIRR